MISLRRHEFPCSRGWFGTGFHFALNRRRFVACGFRWTFLVRR